MIIIDVAKNFSRTPFGRYPTDGEFSAERFREEVLIPALNKDDQIEIDFTKVALGVGSSFLEEAFGGLVRKGYDKEKLINQLHITAKMPLYKEQVTHFIEVA
jgi:hypothetical protein